MAEAQIGIKVLLEDAAKQGLYNINSELGRMSSLAGRAGADLGGMNSVLLGIFAGTALAFAGFTILAVKAIQLATQFQTILIQMGRAGNLTQAQMDALGQSLMNIGGHSIFSIEELGNAFVVLLQRGVSAEDIMHGVGQSAVYLAEATGMKAVPAAQLLASTLISFHLPASEAAKTVDLLQFAIEHGIGPSDEMASSLTKLGSIAYVLHLNLADIIPAFDVLSRATGSYSLAATNLYYFLNQVKFGTATYRDEITKLGISFYDARGNFIGLNAALELLYKTLQNKTPQEAAAILGSLFNIRSSQGIAILEQGLKGVYDLTNKLVTSSDNMGVAMARAQQAEQSAAGLWQSFKTNLQDVLTLMGGPFLGAIQPMLARLNELAIQLRTFAAQNPQTMASFVALGLAISGMALIVMVAMSPFGPLIAIILATVAAITLGTLAAQKFIPIWGQWLDWFSGKSEIDAERIKAANLSMSQGVDEAKLKTGFKNIENLEANHYNLMQLIAKSNSPVMVQIYEGMDAQILQELAKARDNQIAIQKDKDAKQLALHQTDAGKMILAERALQSDLRAANDTKTWVADLTTKRDALYQVLLTTNDKQKKAEIQHQLDMLNAQINGGNLQIVQDQKDADKQRALLDKLHKDELASHKTFWSNMLDYETAGTGNITTAFTNTFGTGPTSLTAINRGGLAKLLSDESIAWGSGSTSIPSINQAGLAKIVGQFNITFGTGPTSISSILKSGMGFSANNFTAGWGVLGQINSTGLGNMTQAVQNGLNAFVGWWAGLPGRIQGAVNWLGQWLYNEVVGWIQGMANAAWAWVGNFLAPFRWAAEQIASLLAHSTPKEGPLAGDDQWMPDMMKMLTEGVQKGAPQLQMAFYGAASGLASAPYNAAGGGGGGTSPTVIYLDGKVIYDNTMSRMRGDLAMNGLGRAFR